MTDLGTRSPLNRRSFLALGGAVGAGATLAACGGTSSPASSGGSKPAASDTGSGGGEYTGPAVSLAFWNGLTGGDGDVIKKMVTEFNASAKNIKVSMNIYQWADLFQKLPAAVTTGRGPDVGIMHIDDIPTNAARNIIVPVDKVVQALGFEESDFSPAVWQGGVYNGVRYGIPLDIHPLCQYWNKTLFTQAGLDPEKAPATKDEFMNALDKLKAKGIQGHWVSPFQFTGGFEFQSLLYQFGGTPTDKEITKATFNDEAGVNALTFMVDLVKNGYSPKNVGQDADYIAFKNNKNAINWNGIWQINDLKTTSLEWGCGPVAQIGTQKGVWGNSHQFVQLRQTKPDQNKIDATRFFINWMSQRSAEWATSGKIPARESVKNGAEFKALAPENSLAEVTDYVQFPPAAPGIGDALTEMYNAVNKAVLLKSSPEDALNDAAKKATQVIETNKKKYAA